MSAYVQNPRNDLYADTFARPTIAGSNFANAKASSGALNANNGSAVRYRRTDNSRDHDFRDERKRQSLSRPRIREPVSIRYSGVLALFFSFVSLSSNRTRSSRIIACASGRALSFVHFEAITFINELPRARAHKRLALASRFISMFINESIR